MNRSKARAMWQAIADGYLEDGEPVEGIDPQAWIREVAARVLKADKMKAGARPAAIVKAVGLHGKADDLDPLWKQIEMLDGLAFQNSDPEDQPARGERMRVLVAAAEASGLVDHLTKDELRKRIERLSKRKT